MSNHDAGTEVALVAALAAGSSVRDAAAAAGISERTAHRRLTEASVRREVSMLRAAALEEAACALATASRKAVQAVIDLLDHEDPKVRLQAAKQAVAMVRELGDEAARQSALVRNAACGVVGFTRTVDEIEAALAGSGS
jgi:HEAT repeat protein